MSPSDVISALSSADPLDAFWSSATSLVPWVAGVLIFAFGLYMVRRLIKGVSKGKTNF